ncbi:MAG: hypothetical protein J1E05_01355 [Eubacterium sp.]|nr:hypothetical protein [Eubacterium sp.]
MIGTDLTTDENNLYSDVLKNISTLPDGLYYAKDFFGNAATNPRVVKKLYKDVKNGTIPGVSLIGERSRDGYEIKNN